MERRGTDCGEKEKIKEHDNNFEASYQRWKCSAHSSQVAAHLTVSLLHSTQSAQLPFLLLATLQQYLYGRTLLGQHQAVLQLSSSLSMSRSAGLAGCCSTKYWDSLVRQAFSM